MGQFHQHFTRTFFVRKSFEQLFCTYSVGLYFFGARILAQKLLVNTLIKLTPGHNNIVAVSATLVTAKEDDLKALKPKERHCLFADENYDLKMHRSYSQSNCLFECFFFSAQLKMQLQHNNTQACIPWFFPQSGKINNF